MEIKNKIISVLSLIVILLGFEGYAQSSKQMTSKMITKENDKYDDEYLVSMLPGFKNHHQNVNGTKLHYVSGGTGSTLILLPGWPQTWWSYHKIMSNLAKYHKVIVIDYRGMGSSEKPAGGYSKKNMAADIASLIRSLGPGKVSVAGHDIGANVAISFAGNYPELTEKLIVLDTQHPEEDLYKLPMLPVGLPVHPWWVAFNQIKDLPEDLLEGRFHIVQQWIFDQMLVNKDSISEFDRHVYARAYETKEAIRASNGWYQAFPEDIQDIKHMKMIEAQTLALGSPNSIPMLKASLPNYIMNLQLKEIENSGHFILEEQPAEVANLISEFLK
ncbi:alpha/beta fold hydrolase [Chryseobacterium indoltheticum]|uniref:alpha/beta fold hydrolase n=1 Tax=Chryseobacterium indoltheticum TaxID=254 RepID=UPI001F41C128|nr:alpha/beta hydrolase [Chryseobacterium indoltheticum]